MNKNYIIQGGELKAYSGTDLMEISGWVSTGGIDLANEIVEPSAAKKHLDAYRKAGRLWFNHDPNQVLGRVNEISIEEKGLHANRIKLSDTPFNREYIWPHIKEGALSEFSIQFQSRKGHYEKKTGIYHHDEIFLIECSIVSVACNPAAVIDGFKSLIPSEEWYGASLSDLAKLYDAGELKLPSEVRTQFAVNGFKGDNLPASETMKTIAGEALTPDFADVNVIELTPEQKSLYTPSEDAKPLPKEVQANYHDVCECIYLAKSESRNSYMFRIGVPTDTGYKYDWDSVALSLCNILGAKGPAHFNPEQKTLAIKKLLGVYKILRKQLPSYEGVSLDQVANGYLTDIRFKDVEFNEGERKMLEESIFINNLKGVVDFMKSKNDQVNDEEFQNFLKYAYGSVGFSVQVSPYDDKDWALLNSLFSAFQAYQAKEEESDNYMLSFAEFLSEYAVKSGDEVVEEATIEEVVEETVTEEVTEVDETPGNAELAEALKTLLSAK